MENPIFADDADVLLNWAAARINPQLRRLAAAVGLDADDLRQEAALSLLKTPPRDGIPKSTAIMRASLWAAAHVGTPLRFKRRSGQVRTYPTDQFDELRSEPEDLHGIAENREIVTMALRCLPHSERRVIELRYGLGVDRFARSQRQVAAILGISGQLVGQREASAMRRIRKLPAFQSA